MNNQTTLTQIGAFSTRTLVNFPFLDSDSLVSLIETLNFKMGLTELRFCQNFFRSNRLDNPTIHELKIIDRVYYDHSKTPDALLVSSFLTNDKRAADTFADLMARRRAVDPDYSEPCSVSGLLGILPEFIGKKSLEGAPQLNLFAGSGRINDASAARHKTVAETKSCAAAIALRRPHPKDEPLVGDYVYAVLKSFNDCEDFEQKLEKLLASHEFMAYFKKASRVCGCSIITALTELDFGAVLNPKPFEGKDGCISPFEPLAEADDGAIGVFSKLQVSDMLVAAQELGLRVICLGQLTGDKKFTSTAASGETLSISLELLSSIKFLRPKQAETSGSAPLVTDSSDSLYISIGGERYRMNSATCGGKTLFDAGFNTVVQSYALCAASGAEEVIGASVYTLPLSSPSAKDLGDSIELILGAYRAECELGIVDVCPKIEIGENPSLCFHTLSKAPFGAPTKISAPKTRVVYLEAERTEDMLPYTEALKALYRYVKRGVESGEILAVSPAGIDLDTALSNMLEGGELIEKEALDLVTPSGDGLLLAVRETELGVQGLTVAHIKELPAPEPTDDLFWPGSLI